MTANAIIPNSIIPPTEFAEDRAAQHAKTLQFLHNLTRGAALNHALHVGEYLLQHYFANDVAALSSRNHNKLNSFEELLRTHKDELAEMGLSGQVLRNNVRAFVVFRALPETTRVHLDFTDLVALAPVKDEQKRGQLALEAAEAGWTSRQVKAKAQELGKRKGKKPGPTPKPALLHRFGALTHALKKLPPTPSSMAKLGVESQVELVVKVAILRDFVEKWEKVLAGLK